MVVWEKQPLFSITQLANLNSSTCHFKSRLPLLTGIELLPRSVLLIIAIFSKEVIHNHPVQAFLVIGKILEH